MAESPDPWRAVVEVAGAAEAERAEHPELAARLAAAGSRFGSARHDVRGLLDDVDRRAVIDVDAPVDAARPVVPQLKWSVRKAVAFVARHLAQQTTAVVSGLSAAVRLLDERVGRLEVDGLDAVVSGAPDVRAALAGPLGTLEARAGGVRRDVGSGVELATLPTGDAGLVVAYRLLDVGPLPSRLAALDQLVRGVAAGGWLAVVSVEPGAWADLADPVTRDLAVPGPMHAETWAHLLGERGGRDVEVHHGDGAFVVAARW
jgi:hypothetical protein